MNPKQSAAVVAATMFALVGATARCSGNASSNSECQGGIGPAKSEVPIGGSVGIVVLPDYPEKTGPDLTHPVVWTTNGGGHFAPSATAPSSARVSTDFFADGPPGSYVVTADWPSATNGGAQCVFQSFVTVLARVSDAGSAPGTDSAPAAGACTTLAVTSVSPGGGPLGRSVVLSGTGFACLKYLDFRTSSDIHTFMPQEYSVTGDTTLHLAIPATDDAKKPLEYTADCIGQFSLLSTDPKQSTVRATYMISGTGTSICP